MGFSGFKNQNAKKKKNTFNYNRVKLSGAILAEGSVLFICQGEFNTKLTQIQVLSAHLILACCVGSVHSYDLGSSKIMGFSLPCAW